MDMDIVGSKENIQPLRYGRSATRLQTAIQAQTDADAKHVLQMKRNEFETSLRNTDVEDPLGVWCDYVSWIEQSYLHQPKEGNLRVVIKKCINKFKDMPQYQNDPRFVKLCIKYADLDDNTLELLMRLNGHGIGITCADFYIAWAERLAVADSFKKANRIYEKGLERGAQPQDLLKAAQANFHAFLVRRMLDKNEMFQPSTFDSYEETPSLTTRQPYNVLKPRAGATGDVVPAVRVGDNVAGCPGKLGVGKSNAGNANAKTTFKPFEDPSSPDAKAISAKTKLGKLPGPKASKENAKKPGVWTNSKKHVPFTIPEKATTPFKVHVDEVAGVEAKTMMTLKSTALQPKNLGYEEDNYANAPMFCEEPHDPTKRPMYDKHKVYAGGVELQLEEIRAMMVVKKQKEREEKEKKEREEIEEKERLKREKDAAPEPSIADTTYADHTIHTKKALMEMQQLWFSKTPTPVYTNRREVSAPPTMKPSRIAFQPYVDESCVDAVAAASDRRDVSAPATIKPSRIAFQPFVDESCVNAAAAVDLTVKSASNSDLHIPPTVNFQVYVDEKAADESDKENLVPRDYDGPVGKSTRRVTGILTPAENVPLPEDDSDEEDDEDEEEEEEVEQEERGGEEFTENFTRAFQFPKQSSTPNISKITRHHAIYNDETVFIAENEVEEKHTQAEALAPEVRPNLSVIAETSREYKSSSSGSSGVSTFKSKNYPYTPSELRGNDSNRHTTHKYSYTPLHFHADKTKGMSTASATGYEASAEVTAPGLPVLEEVEQSESDTLKEDVLDVSDPFDDTLLEQLLTRVDFRRRAGKKAHFCDDMPLRAAKVDATFNLGGVSWTLKKVLGEGSYAKVFLANNHTNSRTMVAKYQKPAFPWEFYITEEIQKRLPDKAMAAYFMNVEQAYFFSNASVLLTSPVEYGDLLSASNTLRTGGAMTHVLAMYFTSQMLQVVEVLHSMSIIHADLKPDNFLLIDVNKRPHVQLIDFGRSIDMSLLPPRTTFTKAVTTKTFTCVEMQTGRPWTYQTDLYGLAGCSHCLLFGEYMKVVNKRGVWGISKAIPRYFAATAWKAFFQSLLNIESCDKLPDLKTLRDSFNSALDNEESSLKYTLNQATAMLNNH